MFFSEEMKQTIPDKKILKRLQRSEICLYLIAPIFTVLFFIASSLLFSYQLEQDWHAFYRNPHGTSVYAHGEVFTDVWGSGTPQIVELFSDYGLDYRKFEEKERFILFEYKNSKGEFKELYTVQEFNRLKKQAYNKVDMQRLIFISIFILLLISSTLIFGWDYAMGLRWLKSGSDDVNDLYRLLRKKPKKEHKRNKQ